MSKVDELKEAWHEAARNNAPNKWDLYKAWADAKIDEAMEESGFNKACEELNAACERLAKNTEEMHKIVITGLTKSADNLKKAVVYSNQTIAILNDINNK